MRGPSVLTAVLLLLGRLLILLSFVFSPGISNAKYVQEIRIEHSPSATVPSGERIRLEARISAPDKLGEVRCYFKYESDKPYLFVEMRQTGQGFECWLPTPASHVDQVEYLFLAVNSMSHVVKTHVFHASIEGNPVNSALPSVGSASTVSVKSDIPIPTDVTGAFAATDRPDYQVVSPEKRYGLRVALYDVSRDPNYVYGFFGGFEIDPDSQQISPVRGFMAFPVSGAPEVKVSPKQEVVPEIFPEQRFSDINGSEWSGYFYVVDKYGNLLSGKTPVTATVNQDDSGNVAISISNKQCPGRSSFSRGLINESGYISIYDDCDGELWTTHDGPTATSTSIYIMDFVDPLKNNYNKLNVVDLTRPEPNPAPAMPTLLSPLDGAKIDSRGEVLLEWSAAEYAVNYQVQQGGDCETGVVYEPTSLTSTPIDVEPYLLNYWRVRGQNSIGVWGPWSPCWSFTVEIKCPACPSINLLLLEK